jgi:dTDP-4-dehydrorhamnose reductase
MRLLVTGGRGLLGGPLTRLLAARHEVLVFDVDDMDVTDEEAVLRTVARARPDRVVHLAAWTDVDGCEKDPARADRVNAGGTRNVAQACREVSAPLLHVSTDYVFDGAKEGTWNEGDAPRPLSAYGRSKLAAEEHVRGVAPRWTIVRAQSLYGKGAKSFPDAILGRARAAEARASRSRWSWTSASRRRGSRTSPPASPPW